MPSKPIRIYDFSQEAAGPGPAAPVLPPSSGSSLPPSIDFGTGDEEEDLFQQAAYNERIVQRYNKPAKKQRDRSRNDDNDEDEDEDSEVNSDEELTEADEEDEEEEDEDEEEDSLCTGSDVDADSALPPRPRHESSFKVTDKKDRKVG